MQREIVITDLTRFKTKGKVCIAGVDRQTGDLLRPMPYLDQAVCEKLGILPGSILSGDFTILNSESPHTEDAQYRSLSLNGAVTSDEFRNILDGGACDGLGEAFDIDLRDGQKYIPIEHEIDWSIATIRVEPSSFTISEDKFAPGRIKLTFVDLANQRFRFFSITDLGFYEYAIDHHARDDLDQLNEFVRNQDEVFLRVGLSRAFAPSNQPNAYWMQVNGIYTFPNYLENIRSYEE